MAAASSSAARGKRQSEMWCMAIQNLAVRQTTAALGRAAVQLVAMRRVDGGQRPRSAGQHSTAAATLSTLPISPPANRYLLFWKALIALSVVSCAAEAPLDLAPIGAHQVEIGQTWALRITAVGGNPPFVWRIKAGPALAIASTGTADCLLTWTPTLLDLAPTKAGQARAPGPPQTLVVEVVDGARSAAQATGALQAVPALLAP